MNNQKSAIDAASLALRSLAMQFANQLGPQSVAYINTLAGALDDNKQTEIIKSNIEKVAKKKLTILFNQPIDAWTELNKPSPDVTWVQLLSEVENSLTTNSIAHLWLYPNTCGQVYEIYFLNSETLIPQPPQPPDYPNGFYNVMGRTSVVGKISADQVVKAKKGNSFTIVGEELVSVKCKVDGPTESNLNDMLDIVEAQNQLFTRWVKASSKMLSQTDRSGDSDVKMMAEASVCPEGHHLKDGSCRRDYCFCKCARCEAQCGEVR